MPEPVTDRDMIVQLAERVMGWETRRIKFTEGEGWEFSRKRMTISHWAPTPASCGRGFYWNSLESPADALELEGLVPEAKIAAYVHARCWEVGVNPERFVWGRADETEFMQVLRATPRQISTAVFSVMCQEGK